MWFYHKLDNIPDYETITSIEQVPEGAIGFIYLIEYVDGCKYIGKKNLYSKRTVAATKSDKPRKNTIDRIYKNTGKGFRQAYDVVLKESDWLTYKGSHRECTIRIVKEKHILQFAYSKAELTYLEAKYLFSNSVLESSKFLNDNILGSFFRNNIHG